MQKLFILVIAAAGTWWYFVGGRKIDEAQVHDYYHQMQVATLDRKPDNLCALLAPEFQSSGTVRVAGQSRIDTQNREQVCASYQEMYDTFAKLGEQMGGLLQLNSSVSVNSVVISPDGKTATVDLNSSLDVGGSIMNLRSHSTDTLVRRNGKVLMLNSTGTGAIGGGG
ncbi:MAG: hypothetical protein KDF54_16085 [Hydrogenophaga sp.]|nr:hypothetical protein [Hydrogenophaga sp.]